MKANVKPNKSYESGITLVALIITIILLVILAAVSIKAIYDSGIIGIAINGTINYTEAGINENKIMEDTESMLDSAIGKIEEIMSGEGTSSSEPEEERYLLEPSIILTRR